MSKTIVWISIIAFELWVSEIFKSTLEVKFDLGGQSSFGSKVASLNEGYCRKILVLIFILAFELEAFEGQSSFC